MTVSYRCILRYVSLIEWLAASCHAKLEGKRQPIFSCDQKAHVFIIYQIKMLIIIVAMITMNQGIWKLIGLLISFIIINPEVKISLDDSLWWFMWHHNDISVDTVANRTKQCGFLVMGKQTKIGFHWMHSQFLIDSKICIAINKRVMRCSTTYIPKELFQLSFYAIDLSPEYFISVPEYSISVWLLSLFHSTWLGLLSKLFN